MKFMGIVVLLFGLIFNLGLVRQGVEGPQRIKIVGQVEDIKFGPLINAPNGHVSFQKEPGRYRIWVPGRLNTGPSTHDEGGFLVDVPNWSAETLAQAQSTLVLGHAVDENNPKCGAYSFDLNYAAMNAVVPGAEQGSLLAFYDAEYHAVCGSGEPLLSSIGIATSVDGGVTWQNRNQIIQGLDEANLGATCVTQIQQNAYYDKNNPRIIDCGASGPSAVVRLADGTVYLYLYYADRKPLTGGRDSIYVARALLASDGQPGNWQKWNGTAWGSAGDQTSGSPIVTVPAASVLALQPHVSWNTTLSSWLMVFKTANDFEVATSSDGVNWSAPVSLLPFSSNDKLTGFPSLVSINNSACDACDDLDAQNSSALLNSRNVPSQQVTGANGYLYYSSLPYGKKEYVGHRVPFTISAGD